MMGEPIGRAAGSAISSGAAVPASSSSRMATSPSRSPATSFAVRREPSGNWTVCERACATTCMAVTTRRGDFHKKPAPSWSRR